MGIRFQRSTYQKSFWMSPANSGLCSCFCTSPPPHTSALLFCFSVLCLRVMERVLLKMLRSNLILYISQGRSRSFLYISNKGLYTLWGSTVCIHCLFSCPVVAAFVPVCPFFFTLLSRFFLVQEIFVGPDRWHGQ